MTDVISPSRRGFLTGLGAVLITAPAIVRAASLMPVKALEKEIGLEAMLGPGDRMPYLASPADVAAAVRRAFVPRLYVQRWQAPEIRNMLEFAAGA